MAVKMSERTSLQNDLGSARAENEKLKRFIDVVKMKIQDLEKRVRKLERNVKTQ